MIVLRRMSVAVLLAAAVLPVLLTGCGNEESDEIVLRVCNWEEYIDEGDWGEDDT